MALGTRRIKSVEDSIRDTDEPEHRLKKHLSGLDLTVFGVGVIIGTGIFVLTGVVARDQAGPAVAISFVIAGVVCGLAALCYAEFASTVPVAGSAYTFSYATFGEFVAWIIGWDLVLELALGAATVAVGWSGYLNQLLDDLGIPLPTSIAGEEATVNIPAVVIVLLMTDRARARHQAVVPGDVGDRGDQAGDRAARHRGGHLLRRGRQLQPLRPAGPAGRGGRQRAGTHRWSRSVRLRTRARSGGAASSPGGAVVFFAFIGFDIVATAAEETRNPGRDLPARASSARWPSARCSTWRCRWSSSACRSTPSSTPTPRWPSAFPDVGLPFFSGVISVGALAGLTSVVMILMLGQSRVLFAMSRDRLLPPALAQVHPKLRHPVQDHDHHRGRRRRAGGLRAARGAGRRWSTSARCSPSCWCRSA